MWKCFTTNVRSYWELWRRTPLRSLGFKGATLVRKNFNDDNINTSGLTGFIIENMGPLETFLDVLLLYEYFLRTILSQRVGPGQVHLSLNSQLQTIESHSCVTITKVGYGVQSLLFNENLWPKKRV